jgi:hypothetical protein
MKTLILFGLIAVLGFEPVALGEEPSSRRDVAAVEGGGTPIPFRAATVVAFKANKSIELTMDGRTTHFRLSSNPVFIGADGILTDPPAINRGVKVRVHFMQENDETLVDRVVFLP